MQPRCSHPSSTSSRRTTAYLGSRSRLASSARSRRSSTARSSSVSAANVSSRSSSSSDASNPRQSRRIFCTVRRPASIVLPMRRSSSVRKNPDPSRFASRAQNVSAARYASSRNGGNRMASASDSPCSRTLTGVRYGSSVSGSIVVSRYSRVRSTIVRMYGLWLSTRRANPRMMRCRSGGRRSSIALPGA